MSEPTPPAVAVIGLGYVGLPLAVALAKGGLQPVLGFDTDATRVRELGLGHDRTAELGGEDIAASGVVFASDPARLAGAGIYIVAVPTPVDADNRPDLSALRGACASIGRALATEPRAAEPIVVFESSVYPGVTEDICGPAIEAASGLVAGRDFFLGYSPERVNPGDRRHTVRQIAKVVAGQTAAVAERLLRLYGRVTTGGIFVARDIRTAEAAKAIENAQRDINIAFVNEVTKICERLGISVFDVLDAARSKWNFLDFQPGLVGGHCIGVDPFYLAYCAQAAGLEPEIVLAGRRINDGMGDWFAERIAATLGMGGDGGGAGRCLVLGLTFKENVPDLRNSRVADLIRGLERRGLGVGVHDPRADAGEAKRLYGLTLLSDPAAGAPYDCLVGAVAHDAYASFEAETFRRLLRPGGLVADLKGQWRRLELPAGLRRWQP
jgi:UDP-N-acetyl-D-galactosamine dehydrogenase